MRYADEPSRREQTGSLIAEKARTLISAFRTQGEVELIAAFTGQLPLHVIVGMFGFPPSEYERFSVWYKALAASFANLTGDPAVEAAGRRVRQETAAYLLPIIAERRARPGADLISTLCHAEVDGGSRLSDEEIRARRQRLGDQVLATFTSVTERLHHLLSGLGPEVAKVECIYV